VPRGATLVVLGLGPIGDMACRIAQHQGVRVIGVDLVPGGWRGRGTAVSRCWTDASTPRTWATWFGT